MTSTGQIRWKSSKRHLDTLLPGWREQETTHKRLVFFADEVFPLPKGAHGRADPEIQLGQVRRMSRFFGKLDEAKKQVPRLR